MQIRTDLAIESGEISADLPKGVTCNEEVKGSAKITRIIIENKEGEAALSRPMGRYVTVEVPALSDGINGEETANLVANELEKLIPKSGTVLVVGLGNKTITPDALGPAVCDRVLATRHIEKEILRSAGIENVRSVAVVAPGVLGQTGIESFDVIKGLADKINPAVVITVDALASRKPSRLGKTVQMTDTGIQPGAGVGNARREINKKTLGVSVVALGVPTVVDAATLVYDMVGESKTSDKTTAEMIVTPREIDLIIDRAATLIADALNLTLQQGTELKLIKEIMG